MNIYILSDSQAAIETPYNSKIHSRLFWDCHRSLTILAELNKILLVCIPEHNGIDGSETADKLAEMVSLFPFIGPETACSISGKVTGTGLLGNTKKHW
jgi:hypothetical protein